jgi:uncharacterized protein (DUF2147 family)
MNTRNPLAAALVLAVAIPALAAGPAQARSGDEVRATGSCTGSADVRIKAKHDDGRIEIEAEVDSNHNGQVWRWSLRHNGDLSYRGRARTVAPSGSFSIERRPLDVAGSDAFKFRAKHRASGQVCTVRVKL